ncbi:hypothetical protein CHISP_3294 [Chitinispirillum alkaliphilum]|nr:hypothetical protein CHISP_3294 [Chitinispirillum alkaliphilum]
MISKKTPDSTGDRVDRKLRQRRRAIIEYYGKKIGVCELFEVLGNSRATFYISRIACCRTCITSKVDKKRQEKGS